MTYVILRGNDGLTHHRFDQPHHVKVNDMAWLRCVAPDDTRYSGKRIDATHATCLQCVASALMSAS